jgi:hypothetical protein
VFIWILRLFNDLKLSKLSKIAPKFSCVHSTFNAIRKTRGFRYQVWSEGVLVGNIHILDFYYDIFCFLKELDKVFLCCPF